MGDGGPSTGRYCDLDLALAWVSEMLPSETRKVYHGVLAPHKPEIRNV